jgi:hypothetical protein
VRGALAHVVGPALRFFSSDGHQRVRQRCGWCGALLLDVPFTDDEEGPVTWDELAQVRVIGGMIELIDTPPLQEDNGYLVEDSCAFIDHSVTR